MLSAEMLVMLAVAVGPTLPNVDVSIKDRLAELFSDTVGNGCVEGLPDVSRVVFTAYDKDY